MSKRILVFEIYRDGALQRTERLDREIVKIGNLPTSHLHIDDAQVSGIHAVIEVSGATVHLIDLGSTHGTRVNGERINKCELRNGDELTLGSTQVRFRVETVEERPAKELAAAAAKLKPKPERVSDAEHYARRFLSQPSRTDGTIEVAHVWHDHVMAEVAMKKGARSLTVGSHQDNDIIVDDSGLDSDRYALITRSGENAFLHLKQTMRGEIYVDAERYELPEGLRALGTDIEITPKTRARIEFGESSVFVHQGTRPDLVVPFGGLSITLGLYFLFSIVLHGVLMSMIFLIPPEASSLSVDDFDIDDRLVSIDQLEQEEEPEELPELLEADEGEEEAAALDDELEGRAGLEDAPDEDGRMAIEGPADTELVQLDRQQAREEAADRGALAVLREFNGPSNLLGTQALGYDEVMAFGTPVGDHIGNARGTLGLGRVGAGGSGGGGSNPGGIGIGRISTEGRFGRNGDANLGRDLTNMGEREARDPEVALGDPTVDGYLDRETIRRVMRQHRREIRDCYQRELQRNPDLAGRVVVFFTIDPAGSVAQARIESSDLNNSDVENCVVGRIRRFRFPQPSTPGLVNVNYPFMFTDGT